MLVRKLFLNRNSSAIKGRVIVTGLYLSFNTFNCIANYTGYTDVPTVTGGVLLNFR